jgi:hypothetical protein
MLLNGVQKYWSKQQMVSLLTSVRSRLLEFLLELRDKYPDLDKDDSVAASIAEAEIDSVMGARVYKNCTVIEGKEMRDVYQAGQAGAMGPGAKADNMNFVQVLREAIGGSSLADLANELESLRSAMLVDAKSAEQDAAVSAVADAEAAAKKGDSKGVLSFLKSAGQWGLDVATKIGTTVAGAAIQKSMGL